MIASTSKMECAEQVRGLALNTGLSGVRWGGVEWARAGVGMRKGRCVGLGQARQLLGCLHAQPSAPTHHSFLRSTLVVDVLLFPPPSPPPLLCLAVQASQSLQDELEGLRQQRDIWRNASSNEQDKLKAENTLLRSQLQTRLNDLQVCWWRGIGWGGQKGKSRKRGGRGGRTSSRLNTR